MSIALGVVLEGFVPVANIIEEVDLVFSSKQRHAPKEFVEATLMTTIQWQISVHEGSCRHVTDLWRPGDLRALESRGGIGERWGGRTTS